MALTKNMISERLATCISNRGLHVEGTETIEELLEAVENIITMPDRLNVKAWPRLVLVRTVRNQWAVIEELERKLSHGK